MASRATLLGLAAALATGAAHAGADGIAPEREALLRNLVAQDCGSCHGLTRKGGLGAPLTEEALEGHSAASLAAIILDGVPGTAMPPWRPLMSETDALWIADYLLGEKNE